MADKLAGGIKAGSVDVSVGFVLRKTADNTEQTGKVAADMTLSYWRQGGLRVAIAASDLAAVDSVHADGGVKEVDATNLPGLYRLDLPDAAIATGADWVTVGVKVAATYLFFERFALTTNVVQTGDNFARLGAPAGASVSADVATRASQASVDVIDDFLDTEIAAILAAVDTEVADIKAKTDALTLTGGKVTPIDVDGLTYAKLMEVLIALCGGVTAPSGSTVAFKKRDGTTTTITVTYGATDGERTVSTIA